MRTYSIFTSLVLIFSLLSSIDAYARDRNPCKNNGSLKRWADRAGYDQNYCSATQTTETNSQPSVSIISPTEESKVEEGTALSFSATAQDAEDGDISSTVLWSSSIDGEITSLATLSAGTHTITANVTDSGGLSASDQLILTVDSATATTASINISWAIPDSRENGDSLELYEIAGYEILYRKTTESLFSSEIVGAATTTAHVISGLDVGDYEFKIATYDIGGLYSSYQTITVSVL